MVMNQRIYGFRGAKSYPISVQSDENTLGNTLVHDDCRQHFWPWHRLPKKRLIAVSPFKFRASIFVESGMSMSFHLLGEMSRQHFCTTFRFSQCSPAACFRVADFAPAQSKTPCIKMPYQWLLPSESPRSSVNVPLNGHSSSFFIMFASFLPTFPKISGIFPSTSPSPHTMPSMPCSGPQGPAK